MAIVETIKIVSKDSKQGYIVINKSDLTGKHTLYEEKKIVKSIPSVKKGDYKK